ncbi:hypothetical protein DPMN_010386 [Dreissena polymorpha]|uniref:Uncharacterized protein n=1 Tax=Dreissena polymorpha TaxID=45954 RepID=A0A9D4RZ69_DREPO|nr:hypothetical protein DPMN_010386 [Dreissena polymorpha]
MIWQKNVTSIVKTAPPPWRPYICKTNLLTKFHDDWAKNVTFRVFTSSFNYKNIRKLPPPPPGNHVIQLTGTIFELNSQGLKGPKKNAPPTGGHVFQATGTIFKLVQNIIGTNLLTKFHNNHTMNMASRVLTRKNATPPWWPYIIGTNHLTKFHDDRTINVASKRKIPCPLVANLFYATKTIFELIQNIIRTILLTKFNENRKINVAWRVLTRKNAPLPGSHVFQPIGIIF